MKTKIILLTSCLVGTLTFSSCEKNLYDESKQPEQEIQMKDLNIPADFQWKLTQVAGVTVSATTPTMVSLFLDEACSDGEKIATIPVDTETSSLPLSIPTYAKTLYAQYETNNGTKKVAIPVKADGSFSLNLTDVKTNNTRAITRGNDIEDDIEETGGVIYHPKDDWGTIMFEDQFPSLGDYDFNDFVVNYKVQFQDIKKEKGKEYTAQTIQIGLRLRAVGGVYRYSPFLRLKKINSDEVESIEIYHSKNIGGSLEVELVPNEHLIIDCRPLTQGLSKPAGSQYYNTERNFLVDTKNLPEIHILITLKEAKEIKEILEDDEFDLYLKHDDNGTEIHMNGIEPIDYRYPFDNKNLLPMYEDDDKDDEDEDDNYYYSKEHLIWGLRVPGNAAHAIEEADFLKAYKGFEKWAVSGGKNEQNWYNQGNADDDLLITN